MELKIIAFFAVFQLISCEHISLIAPPILKRGQPYNAAIITSKITKKDVDLAVMFHNEYAGFKIQKGQITSHNKLIEFKNIGMLRKPSAGKAFGRTLKFLARHDGQCVSKEVLILQEPYIAYVFIQTDRPTYMPGEEVKFRIVAFDGDTIPINMNKIQVIVKNTLGNEVQNFNAFEDDTEQQLFKTYGLYENTFKINNHTREGNWRIQAMIDENYNLLAEKFFTVSRKEAPLYEINFNVPEVLFYINKTIDIEISARFKFGSYVKGKAKLIFTDQHGDELYTDWLSVDTKVKKSYHMEDELGLNFNTNSFLVYVDVQFTDDSTHTTRIQKRKIKIQRFMSYEIFLNKPFELRPGLKYQVNAEVKNYYGQTIIDSGFNGVKIIVAYLKKDGATKIKTEHSFAYIRNSIAKLSLQTPIETEYMEYTVRYLESSISERITKDKSIMPSLRVYVENEPKLNKEVEVRLEYPAISENMVMLVVGRNGIVFHKNIPKLQGKETMKIQFNVTKEMVPQAKIVFYTFKDKNIYSGSSDIEMNMLSDNFLNITIPNSENSFNEINKKEIIIDFDTKPKSLVALLAIDKSETFDKNDHDIESADVLKALINKQELYDTAAKMNEDRNVFYDKVNRNYIINLEMMNMMRPCNSNENEILDKIASLKEGDRTNDGVSYYNTEASQSLEFNFTNPRYEKIIRKNFLKTWIWTTNIVDENGRGTIEEKVPDSLTTWLFTGFSMHPKYGFALAKPQELIVSKKFFIELNLPYSIRIGEVLTLDVIVFNFLTENVTTELKIYSLDNQNNQLFEFMELSDHCSYEKQTGNTFVKPVTAIKDVGTKVQVLIRPKINKLMTIQASIKTAVDGKKYEDYIEKTMVVQHEGVEELQTYIVELRPQNDTETQNVNFTPPNIDLTSIEMKAIVTGNIMNNALKKEHMIDFDSSETAIETVGKFLRNIHIYKYLVESRGFNSMQEQELMANVLRGFFDQIINFRNQDMGFRFYRKPSEPSSTWLTAQIALIFGELKRLNLIKNPIRIIEKSLDFCAAKQNIDGSFNVSGYEFKPAHPFVETETSKQVRLTCFYTIAFMKHKNYTKSYKPIVEKAFEFIQSKTNIDNFAAAVCAYAGMYFNESIGENLLQQLKMKSYTDGKNRYWNNRKNEISSDNVRVLISSYVAMAYYKNGDIEEVKPIINFLTKHQDVDGGFGDIYTTSVGMEPLALMAEHYKTEKTDMEVKIWPSEGQPKVAQVNSNQVRGVTILDLPTVNNFHATVAGTGYGFAHVTIVYSYSMVYDQMSDYFAISVSTLNNSTFNVCARRIKVVETDWIHIQVNLPSGFAFLAEKSDLLKQSKKIKAVEVFSGNTVILIHFDDLETVDTCFKIYTNKIYQVDNLKKGSAKIYVYNDKETVSTVFFQLEESC